MTSYDGTAGPGGEDHVVDPALREVADQVRQVLRSEQMRPDFRARLRSDLLAAQAEGIAARAGQSDTAHAGQSDTAHAGQSDTAHAGQSDTARPLALAAGRGGARRWFPDRRLAGWVGAAAAAAAAVAVVLAYAVPGRHGARPVAVVATSNVAGALSADPAGTLRLRFSQPLDHAATLAALHLSPAATLRASWQGDTLAVSPVNGFAPNSGYVLSINAAVARTASGAPLAGDLQVAFGTAPVAGLGPTAAPVALRRVPVSGATDDAEAVVMLDGSLLVTAAHPGPATGELSGLLRISAGSVQRLSAATGAICVSRSGRSVAFLAAGGAPAVVFADRTGAERARVALVADEGSPLGWIDDAEVSYVGGGRLRAVDRAGHVRVLSGAAVDAARDTLVLAPGGRYVYLAAGSGSPGRLIDLSTGAAHPLPGLTGDPAFSPDGGTVVWIDGTTGTPRIRIAASGGGPVLTARLPVRPGAAVSDLAVAPGGGRLVYTVTSPTGQGQLRLASLPDGTTLAASDDGAGQSPNWSASGRLFTVLGHGDAGARIETVAVPTSAADPGAALEATAAAFANAQVGADSGAQRALADPGVALPPLPQLSRAAVLWVQPAPDGTATARVRLTIDPRPDHPLTRQAEETLTLQPASGAGPPAVRAVTVGRFGPAPGGPQVMHLDTDAAPGAAILTFDSDLDPASVTASVELVTPTGVRLPSTLSYDPATRSVTLRPAHEPAQAVIVRIAAGLRDVDGHTLPGDLRIAATLAR
jgi:hypothetical protein